MKNKLAILSLAFVPVICFASFGEQFNSLLERFFDESPTQDVENYNEPLELIEDEILGEDVRSEILREERDLQNIETKLRHDERQLAEISGERSLVEFQLEGLDGDLGLVRAQQDKYNEAVIRWRRELEVITRQKSLIEAELRHADREKQDALQKKYLRSDLSNSQGEISVWDWVFSDKTISQLVEKRRLAKQTENDLIAEVDGLSDLRDNLKKEEQRVARIFLHVQNLEREHAKQQALLAQLTNARANVLARLEFTQGDLENAISDARTQQADSTISLQSLRQRLSDEPGLIAPVVMEKFSYPLRLTPKITARFRDEEYKRALGREHLGTDFWAMQGTPFYAPADGVIKKVAQNGYGYSYLIVDHGEDLYSVFGHISDATVADGQKISRGEQLGLTGGTPGTPGAGFFTTGAHLHMEVFHKGKHVDAENWLE